jgi:hypothetical protein
MRILHNGHEWDELERCKHCDKTKQEILAEKEKCEAKAER